MAILNEALADPFFSHAHDLFCRLGITLKGERYTVGYQQEQEGRQGTGAQLDKVTLTLPLNDFIGQQLKKNYRYSQVRNCL